MLEGLAGRLRVPISIDTYKADIAARAIDCGASMVNDVSALAYDPALAGVVAERVPRSCSCTIAVARRTCTRRPVTVTSSPMSRVSLMASIARRRTPAFAGSDHLAIRGSASRKRRSRRLPCWPVSSAIVAIGRPMLVGPSQKSYLKAALGDRPAAERAWGTAAAVTAAILFGAHIVRVHDVAAMVQVVRVADRIGHYLRGDPSAG